MAERQKIIGQLVDETALDELAHELAKRYQDNLEAARVNASYDLSRAAMNYIFRWKGDTLMLTFRLPEEWYYVEHGRKGTSGVTGKPWPDPVGDIMRWIDLKRLVPMPSYKSARRPKNGRIQPQEEAKRDMARAIVRKIHRVGFYGNTSQGKHLLEKSVVETQLAERLKGILVDAYGKEIRVELADVVSTLKKSKNG